MGLILESSQNPLGNSLITYTRPIVLQSRVLGNSKIKEIVPGDDLHQKILEIH